MAKRVRVPISAARAKLFQLTDLVRSSADDTVVVFEQRGEGHGVALVREARLAYLEARVSELEKRDAPPFKLAGSLSSDLNDQALSEAMRAIRSAWAPSATPAPSRARASRTRRPPSPAVAKAPARPRR